MQGGRGRGNPFFGFGDPFGGMPSLFGGESPFNDPFFTQPFGGILSGTPFMDINSPFMDMNPFGSSLIGPRASPFVNQQPPRLHETRSSFPNNSRGPIIEEINSDDEDSEKESPQQQQQPYIEHPDDEFEGGQQRGTHFGNVGNDVSIMNHHTRGFPQTQSFSFQSSTVTYGGSNGAYHTSSTTRRTGSDGLRFEENKEADSVTGQAAHRLSKGIHDKGHTVTRNLKSDGRVDTMQVLHNINEDEVEVFEEAWKGKARKHVPGWNGGSITNEGLGDARALPSSEGTRRGQILGVRRKPDVTEHGQSSKFRRL